MRKEVNGGKRKARLLIVDDHPLIREGLKRIIESQCDLEICGEACTRQGALDAVPEKKPDLMLLDLLGNGDGLDLIKTLKTRHPALRILVISQLDEVVYAERTLRLGAHGFVMKKQPTAVVLDAVRALLEGQLYVGPRLAVMALHKMFRQKPARGIKQNHGVEALTDRELQIFHLLGSELSVKKIAEELKLSIKTVETHRENIKHKLGFHSAGELASHAQKWIRRNGESADVKEIVR